MTDRSLAGREDVRTLLDHLEGTAIWFVSEPGEFDYISAGFEEIWGIPAEIVEDDPDRLIETIHPDDRDQVESLIAESGREVTTEAYENRIVRPDGTVRWVQTRQVPIWDDDGALVSLVGICTDITEQKWREQELEALNRLLRHDIRNDMNVLLAWAQMLEDHVDAEGEDLLEKMQATSRHIVELTDVARDVAEALTVRGELDLKSVPLRSTVENEIATRRETYPGAEFVVGECPAVEVTANDMLGSVIRNLLNNAVQHNDSDAPVVEVTCEVRDADVLLRVADNGPGIPEAQKESIFGKGVRGAESAGSGMGLYLVRTLVEAYGGSVRVEDNDPVGAVFTVQLPRAD